MTRTTLPLTVVALSATAALLLTACSGGSSNDKGSDTIKGANTAPASATDTPSESASAASDVKRPTITLPNDVKDTFEPETVGDPVKDAVLHDNTEMIRAMDAGIVAQNPKIPAVGFYLNDVALVNAIQWINSWRKVGWTVTGTTRYFNRVVTIDSTSKASLVYCGDESKGYGKVIKTGKIEGTKASKNSYVLYNTQLRKSSSGVWVTDQLVSQRGAQECQP